MLKTGPGALESLATESSEESGGGVQGAGTPPTGFLYSQENHWEMAPPGWNVLGPPKRSKAEGAEMWGTQSGGTPPNSLAGR